MGGFLILLVVTSFYQYIPLSFPIKKKKYFLVFTYDNALYLFEVASYIGRMRCLAALARWEELNNLCKEYWTPAEPAARLEMAPMVSL